MRIQAKFTDDTEEVLRKAYEVAADERLVCGVWAGAGRQGFLFTDKRFYWNLPTVIERKDGRQEIRLPSNILQRNVRDLQAEILFKDAAPDAAGKEPGEGLVPDCLALDSPIGKILIAISSLTVDEARTLRKIFAQYFAYGQFPREFCRQDAQDAVGFALESVADFVHSSTEAPAPPPEGRRPASAVFRSITASVVDTGADLLFAVLVILAVKPVLLYKTVFRPHTPLSDAVQRAGRLLFVWDGNTRQVLANMEISDAIIDFVLYRRNYVVVLLLAVFVALKLFVVLACCRGQRRLLPLLLVALTVPGLLLVASHFLIFLPLILLLYLTMQLALRLPWEEAGSKLLVLGMLILVAYYLLHLFGYPNFVEVMAIVVQRMAFPAAW